MKQAYSKKYIIPAIFLIVSLVVSIIRQLILGKDAGVTMLESVIGGAAILLLAGYCFFLHYKRRGNIVCFVALGILMAQVLVYDILPMFCLSFSFVFVANIFFFLGIGTTIVMKMRPHLVTLIVGGALLLLGCMIIAQIIFSMLRVPTMAETAKLLSGYAVINFQVFALILIMFFALLEKRK